MGVRKASAPLAVRLHCRIFLRDFHRYEGSTCSLTYGLFSTVARGMLRVVCPLGGPASGESRTWGEGHCSQRHGGLGPPFRGVAARGRAATLKNRPWSE